MQIHHEQISVFDIFKIGIGPSSSHTLGPWRAAQQFLEQLKKDTNLEQVQTIHILLYGSLAKTGKGHGTDIAIQLGLMGEDPVTFDVNAVTSTIEKIAQKQQIHLGKTLFIEFNPSHDIVFLIDASLPKHPNALTFIAKLNNKSDIIKTYYSIGGGFVITDEPAETVTTQKQAISLPYPIQNANDLVQHCLDNMMSLTEVVWENEKSWGKREPAHHRTLSTP